jgi:hypothetical protein
MSPARDDDADDGDTLMTNTRSKPGARKVSARRNGTSAITKRQHRLGLARSSKPLRSRSRNSRGYFDYDENTSDATMLAGSPELIDRYNLVRLAARYPVVAIMRAVNGAHITKYPQGVVTLAALQKRLTRAIDRIARDTKRPKTEVQRDFQAKRKENGLRPGSKLISDISGGAALSLLHQAALSLQQNDGSADIDQNYDEHDGEDSVHDAASGMEWIGGEEKQAVIVGLRSPAMENVTLTKPMTPRVRAKTTTPPFLHPAEMQRSHDPRRASAFETCAISTQPREETTAAFRRPSTGTWRDLPPISSSRATYTLPPLITTTRVSPIGSPAFSSPRSSFLSPPSSFSSDSFWTNSFNSNTTTSSASTNSNTNSFSSSLMCSSINKNSDATLTTTFAPPLNIDPYLDDHVYHPPGLNNQIFSNVRGINDDGNHKTLFRNLGYAL